MKRDRHIYLHDIPLEEAWQRLKQAMELAGSWSVFPGEEIPLADAVGRVTAEPIWAALSSPHYHACAMDGFAVRARDTAGASDTRPLIIPLVVHEMNDQSQDAQCVALPVNTGYPLPLWADAVIMIENVQLLNRKGMPTSDLTSAVSIEIRSSVAPWQHVRPMGEDIVATELVLPANHLLKPVDLGAIAASGNKAVRVRRKPRVAIIPTGSELVPVEGAESLRPGENIEYNSLVLAAQVQQWGGLANRWAIVPDEFDAIRDEVVAAADQNDLVLVNAGSSAGTEDYTSAVVANLGEVFVHGVAVRPGHPVILGMVGDTPIVGVPGYPVSAALTGELIVEPILAQWLGRPPTTKPVIEAKMSRQVHSSIGDDEYLRVMVGKVGSKVVATPLSRGAGTITTLVRADGLVLIPRFSEGIGAGEAVHVHLYRPQRTVERTIVAIGSHDMTLDLATQYLAERAPGVRLSSANVGSLGGLFALKRGEAHLAGSHLLNPETGEYNISYIQQFLPDLDVVLVTLVGREQGFIVPPDNPAGLTEWDDLWRTDLRIVNRQRGAGTRFLLDYQLNRLGISPESLGGYEKQEFTHLAVAAAVASGAADFGLGIRAAADALGLDFVPLMSERYDLVIPSEHYDSHLLRPLLLLLHDADFRVAVNQMPGYDASRMGTVVFPKGDDKGNK